MNESSEGGGGEEYGTKSEKTRGSKRAPHQDICKWTSRSVSATASSSNGAQRRFTVDGSYYELYALCIVRLSGVAI